MNNYIIKNGAIYMEGSFQKANLVIQNGIVKEITLKYDELDGYEIYDADGLYIVPGFIDIHTHGAVNIDVNAATAGDLQRLSHYFATQGTTSWLCSILTDTREQTLWCIDQYNQQKDMVNEGARLIGIHLEGPFLCSAYKGAMPEHLLIPPNLDLVKEYQREAKGDVKYMTISPELEGAPEFIKELKKLDIVVAIGHSGADYETAMQCIENGATCATHTFNAMKLMHQHYPAIMGAVLESDIYCEAICDGRHLHPAVFRILLKTKGMDRVIAVTDSIMATGLPDGHYKLGVNDIIVVDGDAQLANGHTRAGSTLTTGNALKNMIKFTNRPLEEVIGLLTENPAKMLGIYDKTGSIAVDKYADIVVLNSNYEVIDSFVQGKLIKK